MDDDLLSIGRIARLAGLTIGALRHYDELDLIRPARVDPETGYRFYGRGQLERARAIVRLRRLELPLDDVRLVLDADDPADARRILAAHRARVEARTIRLQRMLHALGHAASSEEPPMPEPARTPDLDLATRRAIAAGFFNRTWELLEQPNRTPAQDDELIHGAHASRYHWGELGESARLARGEWMCARVRAPAATR